MAGVEYRIVEYSNPYARWFETKRWWQIETLWLGRPDVREIVSAIEDRYSTLESAQREVARRLHKQKVDAVVAKSKKVVG